MLTIIVGTLLILGIFFFAAGSVGILRFPDFYSRLHPAGMLDTMGQFLTMGAMALYTLCHDGLSVGALLTAIKIMFIVLFVFITSPTATHAIIDAGIRAGLKPWTKEKESGGHDSAH